MLGVPAAGSLGAERTPQARTQATLLRRRQAGASAVRALVLTQPGRGLSSERTSGSLASGPGGLSRQCAARAGGPCPWRQAVRHLPALTLHGANSASGLFMKISSRSPPPPPQLLPFPLVPALLKQIFPRVSVGRRGVRPDLAHLRMMGMMMTVGGEQLAPYRAPGPQGRTPGRCPICSVMGSRPRERSMPDVAETGSSWHPIHRGPDDAGEVSRK
ncbi:unnamed protein product [Rangifer tarandus platyrhynchus]|uniref:Uncharacterized protein n=1 Tax=Rangifer tarandus platyrhynchus TaxID=3082113 RepID=A0AC59Z6K8_RANTA